MDDLAVNRNVCVATGSYMYIGADHSDYALFSSTNIQIRTVINRDKRRCKTLENTVTSADMT